MSISIEYCYSRLVLLPLLLKWLFVPIRWLTVPDVRDPPSIRPSVIMRKAVRDRLIAATYGELMSEMAEETTTCAVCLNEVHERDVVWELRNCRHVFHKGCLDTWLDHDEHVSCPLCRAPVVTEVQARRSEAVSSAEPSWAVERLMYFFGDDLLMSQ